MRQHLTLRHKRAPNAVRAACFAEAPIQLEEILGSVFVWLAWCVFLFFLLYCVLILLFNLITHQIDSLWTCVLLILLRVVLNKLHVLCALLYIIVNSFVIIYLFAVVLLR